MKSWTACTSVRLPVALVLLLAAFALALAPGPVAAQSLPPQPVSQMEQWGKARSLPLWPGDPPGSGFVAQPMPADSPPQFIRNVDRPYLKVFLPEHPNGRAMLAIPGGAYTFVSVANEGVDLANVMTARGYTVFVLVYRLPGEGWVAREDVPLQDAQRAMRLIAAHAEEFGLDAERTAAIGFSAGGHLAATLATAFDEPVYSPADKVDEHSARPEKVALIYPVISNAAGIGHAESSLRLLGESPHMLNVVKRSPDIHVRPDMPAMFIVHAMDDKAVPVTNSLIMLGALRAASVPVEAHFFQRGGHAFGVGRPQEPDSSWPDLFVRWLEDSPPR